MPQVPPFGEALAPGIGEAATMDAAEARPRGLREVAALLVASEQKDAKLT